MMYKIFFLRGESNKVISRLAIPKKYEASRGDRGEVAMVA
jgi:hypothetical protein